MENYNRHREFEVHFLTYDGAQHLRLHGWLKRNDVLIKSETIHNTDDSFGRFMVFMNDIMLEKVKSENLERGLFVDIEVMNSESDRWRIYTSLKEENMFEKIQDFLFSFQIKDKNDLDDFIEKANETSITLFRNSKDFIQSYIETDAMSFKDKVKDIDLMIEAFVEEERYEDCALLVKVKDKLYSYYSTLPFKQINKL